MNLYKISTNLTKSRVALVIVLIALVDIWIIVAIAPTRQTMGQRRSAVTPLVADAILIIFGLAAQWWMRERPRFKYLRLLVFALTLAFCMSLGLIVLTVLLGKW